MKKTIILDNGHAANTAGKISPDRSLMEWKWNREMVAIIKEKLEKLGYDVRCIVPETKTDVPLRERCRRVNAICDEVGTANCLFISVHVNAAGCKLEWLNASGWTVWIASNASAKTKRLAQLLHNEAEARKLLGNRCIPPEKYHVANFTVIYGVKCPSVLTENLFMDNRSDCAYLLSDHGKQTIADLHVQAIEKYCHEY